MAGGDKNERRTFLYISRDFQDHADAIYANWDFSGDPCPVTRFQWSVHRFDDMIMVETEDLPKSMKYAH